ncbi:type III-A CRISPR-associated protein Cas10/Csm1 [Microcoleus sp. LEGE 07076]|uniref:type III-A CRISPR-associated protein Cas10/Csm1 n=1 Tax=Microcoleus sp. LEGE 07076 TaxID=915322 RepID=UPI001882EE1E|nr:type III-A CRISPR-associated protein Cas10/Csm1 [Microcoleus sp. LEGE 07076]MBE9186347.1 type III-A CRISPR-associated protein Cas10/Csm1 [Microcoleus sp. LEGE 07076]
MTSQEVALQVIQQAICALAGWADCTLPDGCQLSTEHPAVTKAKELLSWHDDTQISYLNLLFDSVKFPDSSKDRDFETHYCPAVAIDSSDDSYPSIPYPLTAHPNLEAYKTIVKPELKNIREEDWQNLSLLTLILEKYGSCLSFGEPDIALIDMVRSTAAVASALVDDPEAQDISLIAGDLSGIQKFIYTIASDGALKSLRARSFYLELVTEEIVQQLLEELNLPRTNIIYAGGGNLYVLASNDTSKVKAALDTIRKRFNKWLKNTFQGKLFLAIDYLPVPTTALKNYEFAEIWTEVTKNLAKQKLRKFEGDIHDFIQPKPSHEPCRVCHRDDLQSLKSLNRREPDSSRACWMCRTMFELGDELFDVKAIVRSKRSNIKGGVGRIYLPNYYYYFFPECEGALEVAKNDETVLLVNDWSLKKYHKNNAVPLLLGNYAQRSEEKEKYQKKAGFLRANEMAQKAEGIARVGYLRMDVDRLGRIFAEGLGKNQTLPRLAGLSRQMSYFFKVYLNSLAENRKENLLAARNSVKILDNAKCLTEDDRPNLLFIYAGGDDLFVSGAWNEIVEFAFDVYQCFRAYTGKNPDITLSGGISIDGAKFPLYQAAKTSGEAEEAAKGNGRDSLGLFGGKFKWDEWFGIQENMTVIDEEIRNYLSPEVKPELWGIFPIVEQLKNLDINHSHSFIRNLLLTAELQENMLKKIQDRSEEQQREIRYYLHLPKIVYTLARLPSQVRNNDNFSPVRTSLKNPHNAPYFRAIATWLELLNR